MFKRSYYRRIKKDYQHKNLRNPFFHRPEKGKSRLSFKWLIPAVFGLAIFLIWFFLAAPFWRLQQIRVSGLTRVPESALENIIWSQTASTRWLFFKQSDIFLFDKEAAAKTILSDFNFAGVGIYKIWPHTLEIKVSERPYAFIFQEGSRLFYASADAYLIKESAVTPEDQKKYFILENKNPNTLVRADNKINIDSDYLNFILSLSQHLSLYAELPVERFIIDQEFNTVKVKFVNGPLAYFNVKDDAAKQVSLLLLVKREKIKDNFNKTDYIDLRYGDRIFINPDFK